MTTAMHFTSSTYASLTSVIIYRMICAETLKKFEFEDKISYSPCFEASRSSYRNLTFNVIIKNDIYIKK